MAGDPAAQLVSVVMIFKDAQPYLREAAESVLAQTWPHLELVLVDDGGTDGGDAVAADLAVSHPERVRVLSHPGRENRGMSAARALGIDHARGDLVAFLDGDDVWEPPHLAEQLAWLACAPEADMVVGRALTWRSWAPGGGADALTPLPAAPGAVIRPPHLLTAVLRNGAVRTPTCSLLVRAGALRASGGPVVAFRDLYEDQVLLARLQTSCIAVVSGSTTARYRQHAASVTSAARRAGTYSRTRPNPSRDRFLEWLQQQPELAADKVPAELTALLRASRAPVPVTSATARVRSRLSTRTSAWARAVVAPSRVGDVRWGSLRSPVPLSDVSPRAPAQGVADHYLSAFVERCAFDLAGSVLEVGGRGLAARWAGSRVDELTEVAEATFLEDGLPRGTFDCVLAPQVLHLVKDERAVVRALVAALRPGGTLLLTAPGLAPVLPGPPAVGRLLTAGALTALLGAVLPPHDVEVAVSGNVRAAVAALHGLHADEVDGKALAAVDARFPVLVTARALRATRLPDGQGTSGSPTCVAGTTENGRFSTSTRSGLP